MFWSKKKAAPKRNGEHKPRRRRAAHNGQLTKDQIEIFLSAAEEMMRKREAEIRADAMKAWDGLDRRLKRLEGSDFVLNREQFDQTMKDLAQGMPGVPLPPP